MGNPTVLALRIVIALVLAGSLFVQVLMGPLTADFAVGAALDLVSASLFMAPATGHVFLG